MYDVAVIGAGPAGSIAALMLARAGRRVVLVDRSSGRATAAQRRIGESLPGAARPLLRHLGLLELVESSGHLPSVGNSSAWGSERLETTDSVRDPAGPGWHLDRARFDQDLRTAAVAAGAVFQATSVRSITRSRGGWCLKTEAGELKAAFLVNATGRGTLLPQLLGTKARRDDDLVAVYAWLPSSRSDCEDRTLVEAAPEGWWYSSRLPDKSRVLVFHTRPDTARRLLRSRVNFRRQLLDTAHVKGLVRGRARLPLRLAATSACGSMLEAVSGEGWIACGDAAMAFDPLSSQGIFNALYTGMRAGEAAHLTLNGDPGSLQAYGARLGQIRAAYLQHRNQFYSMERRWPNAPFWKGIKANEI